MIRLIDPKTQEEFLVELRHLVKPEEPPMWTSLGAMLAELAEDGVAFSFATPGNPKGGKKPGLSETYTLTIGAGQNRQKVYATGEGELLRQASKILREFGEDLGPKASSFADGAVATATSLDAALTQAEKDAEAAE